MTLRSLHQQVQGQSRPISEIPTSFDSTLSDQSLHQQQQQQIQQPQSIPQQQAQLQSQPRSIQKQEQILRSLQKPDLLNNGTIDTIVISRDTNDSRTNTAAPLPTALSERDKYGLKGLLSVIRMENKDISTLALGSDVKNFGLDMSQPEYVVSPPPSLVFIIIYFISIAVCVLTFLSPQRSTFIL